MNILIVDDDIKKIRNIMKIIDEVDGIDENMIEYSIETDSAKDKLLKKAYDLLILDLNMPEQLINASYERAGEDFIDELIYSVNMIKPLEIVVLSAYDKCEEEFLSKAYRNGFIMLKYDELSSVWSSKLRAIVEYRLLYAKQNEPHETIDFAIITTTTIETEAVKNLCNEWKIEEFKNDVNTYYISELIDGDKKKKIVTVQSIDMGMVAATVSTMNIIRHYNSKYIIIVGIAAGIGDHEYGDILIPREVWNYSCGKYTEKDGEIIFRPDPKVIQLDAKILELVRQDYRGVLSKIKQQWPEKNKNDISICDSPMACGTAVIANKQIVEDKIISHFRKSGGLDMESYGVFFAARSLCDSNPKAICIKSVSDFAGDDKDDKFQPYAAYTSARFTKHMILNVLR